jgi:hypothetical protein
MAIAKCSELFVGGAQSLAGHEDAISVSHYSIIALNSEGFNLREAPR